MGGGFWTDDFYTLMSRRKQEPKSQAGVEPIRSQVPDTQSTSRPTRFDRILDTDEVPSVSSKPSTTLLGSTRFDRILRDDED